MYRRSKCDSSLVHYAKAVAWTPPSLGLPPNQALVGSDSSVVHWVRALRDAPQERRAQAGSPLRDSLLIAGVFVLLIGLGTRDPDSVFSHDNSRAGHGGLSGRRFRETRRCGSWVRHSMHRYLHMGLIPPGDVLSVLDRAIAQDSSGSHQPSSTSSSWYSMTAKWASFRAYAHGRTLKRSDRTRIHSSNPRAPQCGIAGFAGLTSQSRSGGAANTLTRLRTGLEHLGGVGRSPNGRSPKWQAPRQRSHRRPAQSGGEIR